MERLVCLQDREIKWTAAAIIHRARADGMLCEPVHVVSLAEAIKSIMRMSPDAARRSCVVIEPGVVGTYTWLDFDSIRRLADRSCCRSRS